ncbi:Uncharacterised protein [Amycolatopsis camponoti]|uniref:Uncharacterized protein n=1 Tax=Amycolatopsis camponoti TaxID=2606593 RepID=A0A6I8M4Z1_9PSEU|nr:hypothetical protein [Amycolatopsis camponoti]VVJ22703.1 Uncharacterised protein [Amycolatopsis camponoti]
MPEPQHDLVSPAPTTTDAPASRCGDVVDHAAGLPRTLEDKCPTCIFRPGNLMHLADGARDDMVRAALARGSWIVCHTTLPDAGIPRGQQAICRGFWDVHARDSFGCRLANAFGGPVVVSLPAAPDQLHS